MIDWKTIKDLHVIKKMESIMGRWFGVDMIFTDEQGRIQNGVSEKNHEFKSHFFKVQMHMSYGHEYIGEDIEKAYEQITEGSTNLVVFDSFFPGVKGIACKVEHEGEFLGAAFIYPFVEDGVTADTISSIVKKMVECGASEVDAKSAADSLKKLALTQQDYLKELSEIVSEEISSFHGEISKREERILELNSEVGNRYRYHNMIGKSKKMQMVYRLLEKISNSESTILIQGGNGTGKELVAKAIHYNSPRKDAVFISQNCSAFNDNLLDSELFGHVKGSFTGAVKDKKGLFEVANGGTLFLDEVGDTSLTMQVKLLRVLQEGTFLPVGATQPKKVNVRVIAATNRNLKEMIAKGEFREDLYYRINVINVALPDLKERKEDIPILVDYFLEKRCAELGTPLKQLSKKCLEKMLDHTWPGNIRELENEVERLVVLAGDDKMINPDMLSSRILDSGDQSSSSGSGLKGFKTTGTLKEAMEELEILMIREGLKRCNFNKSKLAKELGISRAGLIMKVEKYELDKRKKAVGE
jgi:transcriptional regulator with PAS, ATPase and Fis domain